MKNIMKRILCMILAILTVLSVTACKGAETGDEAKKQEEVSAENSGETAEAQTETPPEEEDTSEDFRIGIVTGSFAQSEDDRRGAEAFLEKYGSDKVTLAIYPDNFTEELDNTVNTIVNLAEDPKMKAIIVNQAVDGTTEAFRQIREKRPDILLIAGEAYEDFADISPVSDLVVNCDFVNRGYLIIHTAHELGCDTFVHISFPRHLSYETVARRVAVMQAACEEFGMKFAMEEAPDPTTEAGVPGAQQFIVDHIPEWEKKYGEHAAYFCTNDAHTEPLIKMLLEDGGYFIEADLPSPLMGYPGALALDLTGETGDPELVMEQVENAVVEKGGEGRFGTWKYSYGYTMSAGLAEHARNVILGESSLTDINDLTKAYRVFSPGADWNGSKYNDAATGAVTENTVLIYQDTYIMGKPGRFMGATKIKVPEEYFTIQ